MSSSLTTPTFSAPEREALAEMLADQLPGLDAGQERKHDEIALLTQVLLDGIESLDAADVALLRAERADWLGWNRSDGLTPLLHVQEINAIKLPSGERPR